MRLIGELLCIPVAAASAALVVAFGGLLGAYLAGTGPGGEGMFLAIVVVMSFWPFVGAATGARLVALMLKRGDNAVLSAVLGAGVMAVVLVFIEAQHPMNRDFGSVAFISMAIAGGAVAGASLAELNRRLGRWSKKEARPQGLS